MRSRSRNFEVYSLSAIDLFASAMGAFIIISIILMPDYQKEVRSQGDMEYLEELSGRTQALLDQAEEVLTEIGDDEYIGLIAIQWARLALARGTDTGPAIALVHAAAARSDAGRLVNKLAELEQDLKEPWALRHGERLERWPEGLRRLARAAGR